MKPDYIVFVILVQAGGCLGGVFLFAINNIGGSLKSVSSDVYWLCNSRQPFTVSVLMCHWLGIYGSVSLGRFCRWVQLLVAD